MLVDVLRSQARVVDRLPPAPVVRVEVSSDGAPVRGAADATVAVIEFSDYHCPYCKLVEPTLKKREQLYHGKIKLIYRNFPLLSLHSQVFHAAEASRCAQEGVPGLVEN
jgi:protein-disulfide isomerase